MRKSRLKIRELRESHVGHTVWVPSHKLRGVLAEFTFMAGARPRLQVVQETVEYDPVTKKPIPQWEPFSIDLDDEIEVDL